MSKAENSIFAGIYAYVVYIPTVYLLRFIVMAQSENLAFATSLQIERESRLLANRS